MTTETKKAAPRVPLNELTTLWFQISGTLCNLECNHCFISCGPKEKRHGLMSREDVQGYLSEKETEGVKEYYLTGGEPFMNPELEGVIEDLLARGSVTVLTNATLIGEEQARSLKKLEKQSSNKLTFRVSVDSPRKEKNDAIRGKGSFEKAMGGINSLREVGFTPIITYTEEDSGKEETLRRFDEQFVGQMENRPDYKSLPLVYLGRAGENIRPYEETERVTENCFADYSMSNLQCSSCRMVTSEGVFVCPILINDPHARMGDHLGQAMGAYEMTSPACYTCRVSGLSCSNNDVSRDDVRDYYGNAAENPQPALCCPTIYDRTDTDHIPKEVLEISYGCGSPVGLAALKEGETFLDLGSGGGIDCFIASKQVGAKGKVMGVDMTDEMLKKAKENREKVAAKLGYNNVEFYKGFLENLPLPDNSVDVVTSNCVINLSVDKGKVFEEMFRVLKKGGRFLISDVISEKTVPQSMRESKDLWGECISGSLTNKEFIHYSRKAGFYGISLLSHAPYHQGGGINFYSIAYRAYKSEKNPFCVSNGQKAVYLGPFDSITDDEEHLFPRGEAVEVCSDTAEKLQEVPYKGHFLIFDSQGNSSGNACGPTGCC